jgi:hypothetical protein
MNIKRIISSIGIGAGAVIIGLGIQIALADWTPAPANPPSNNVAAPINVGSGAQTKAGGLNLLGQGLVSGSSTLDVEGVGFLKGLIVNGAFQYLDGNQGLGKVLTSNANGNASWVSTSTLGIGVGSGIDQNSCAWTPWFREENLNNSPQYAPSGSYIAGIDYKATTGGNDGEIKFWYCSGNGGVGSASGVSHIVAGSNVTLSPSTGVGEVTVNASNSVVASGSVGGGWYGSDPDTRWGNAIQTGTIGHKVNACPTSYGAHVIDTGGDTLCIAN